MTTDRKQVFVLGDEHILGFVAGRIKPTVAALNRFSLIAKWLITAHGAEEGALCATCPAVLDLAPDCHTELRPTAFVVVAPMSFSWDDISTPVHMAGVCQTCCQKKDQLGIAHHVAEHLGLAVVGIVEPEHRT